MGEGRTKKSIRNMAFGMIYKFVSLLFPFAIRTILIYKLGSEYLGLNSLFNSILNVLSLSELGFGSAIVYSMYKPIAEKNKKSINALMNLYRKVYHLIGIIITVVGIILIPFLPYLIKGNIPADINLYLLYLIYLSNTSISYFMFSYKEALFNANQRSDIVNFIKTIINVLMYIVQIIVLLLGGNYYLYIIFLPISTLIINIVQNYYSNKKFPEVKCEGEVSKQTIAEIKKHVFALVGHRIGGTVLYTFDNIVISAFLGLNMVAIYGNYYLILSAIMTTMTAVYNSFTSVIGNSIVVESIEKNKKIFKKLSFANFWISGWCAICLICLAQDFMTMWVGKEYLFRLSTLILLAIMMYVQLIRKIVLNYKDAAGMWWNDRFKPYAEAIFNLIINIILVKLIGINGVIISSIIATALISLPWESHVLYKSYFKESDKNYYKQLLIIIFITVLIGLITYFTCSIISVNGILGLAIKALICVILPNILGVLLSHKTEEFKEFKKLIIKLISKNKLV